MKPLLRLTFPKRATSEQRTKKDMTNITSILTKAEIHALLWKGRRKMMGQNIFHFTLKNNIKVKVITNGWKQNIQNQDRYITYKNSATINTNSI